MSMKKKFSKVLLCVIIVSLCITCLVACVAKNEYKIFFNDGNDVYVSIATTDGGSDVMPDDPIKEGYTFGGWYHDKDTFSSKFDGSLCLNTKLLMDVNIYAKWISNEYIITFDSNTGTEINNTNVVFGEKFEFDVPVKVAYTFDGWMDLSNALITDGDGIGIEVWSIASDVELTAKWSLKKYNIMYNNTFNVENDNAYSYTYESPEIVLKVISRGGYVFDGWYSDSDFTQEVELISSGSHIDLDLFAKWSIITYNVNCKLNGGTLLGENPSEYTAESESIILSNATREGYDFDGWYTDAEFNNKITSIPQGSYGHLELHIKWDYILMLEYNKSITKISSLNKLTTDVFEASLNGIEGEVEMTASVIDGVFKAGATISVQLSGAKYGITKTVVIENIKVYGSPTLDTIHGITDIVVGDGYYYWMQPSDTLLGLFSNSTDSFGENISNIVFGSDPEIKEAEILNINVTITDAAGNITTDTIDILVSNMMPTAVSVNLYFDGDLVGTSVLISGFIYSLPVPDLTICEVFYGWKKGDDLITNAQGDSLGVWTGVSSDIDARFTSTHTANADCVCTKCGKGDIHTITEGICYLCMDSKGRYVEDDYVYFGYYPQDIKESNISVSSVADEDGYFIGSDSEKYAKVISNPYEQGYKFSDNAVVASGVTNYFKVMPIKWRILSNSNGNALIACETIIDNRDYGLSLDAADEINYDWGISGMRAFLNNEFYDKAFNTMQKNLVQETYLEYENVMEKILLLNYPDIQNPDYGFSTPESTNRLTSDYTRSTGAYMYTNEYYGYGIWWNRIYITQTRDSLYNARVGGITPVSSGIVVKEHWGISPSVTIKIS